MGQPKSPHQRVNVLEIALRADVSQIKGQGQVPNGSSQHLGQDRVS